MLKAVGTIPLCFGLEIVLFLLTRNLPETMVACRQENNALMDSVSCLTWNMTVAMHYKTKTTLSIKTPKKTKQIENAGRHLFINAKQLR